MTAPRVIRREENGEFGVDCDVCDQPQELIIAFDGMGWICPACLLAAVALVEDEHG